MSSYTTPLSRREVVTYVAGTALLIPLSFPVRWYVYPWLGVPVIGVSGLAPLVFVFALVSVVLLVFRPFRSALAGTPSLRSSAAAHLDR
jgi:hypothetical protein